MVYSLNDRQNEAVFCTEGPLLIFAGAGGGKTRVLVHRAAHLISDMGVKPYNIMMVTFTNKAAKEMRERIENSIDADTAGIWVATFHSSCVRILRRYADRIGYDNSFTIYDTDDTLRVMKDVCKRLEIDTKVYKEKSFLKTISSCKDSLISADLYHQQYAADYASRRISSVYYEYEKTLAKNNAMDFDDLIVNTVKLLKNDPEVLNYYQNRFEYVMVDEYQDTNAAQFALIRLLSGGKNNLCVVGDDDQSIYRFRGADITNILNFEKYYEDAAVVRLEQNYRSKGNILKAASAVIDNNAGRHRKTLWTEDEDGEPIAFHRFESGFDEARFVADSVKENVGRLGSYRSFAVLYRTNAQSRAFEEAFVRANIPYKVVGGVNFYGRREIKDILAYLKILVNPSDDLSVQRVINIPKRGIGAATVTKISAFAADEDISFFDALERIDSIPGIKAAAQKIKGFTDLICDFRGRAESSGITGLISYILDVTGYENSLRDEEGEDADNRIENISELLSKAGDYMEESEEPTLAGFLEEVALVADIDDVDAESDYVFLMTLHSAKGLEFPYVYMVGMEDGLFPSIISISSDSPADEIEEERRLCYVGMTRAMKRLFMTCARVRMVRGETRFNKVSRFIGEIPKNILEEGKMGLTKDQLQEEKHFKDTSHSIRAKNMLREKPAIDAPKHFGSKSSLPEPEYAEGDRVRHIKFGEGTVKGITKGGKDYEVTVEFDGAGVKKMLSTFAKLKKI